MQLSSKLKVAVSAVTFIFVFWAAHSSVFAATNGSNSVSATSSNWSGYIAQNGVYTGVSGTWTVPTISPSSVLTANATWVGIGGKSSPDLIQAGVYEISNSDGVSYQAWYELLPADSTPISLTVSPGDSISVAIIETSQGVWNIVITNNTTKQQYEKTVNYTSSLSSAEWIQERPLVDQASSVLSGFTPVNFSGATAVQNGQRITLVQTGAQLVNLIDNGSNTALAVPSNIATNGTDFTVFRTSASSLNSSITVPTQIQPQFQQPQPQSQSTVPPFELHRTGHSITWIIRFPLRKI